MIRRTSAFVAIVLLATGLVASGLVSSGAQAHPPRSGDLRPMVFVHGFSGSGHQYETPARRFTSNGYPAAYIEAHEYDSTFMVETRDQVLAGLDQRITRLLAETGADKVDLLGHSLGTFLMQTYLNSS